MTEWFEQWFGEVYHALYPHRDEPDARRAVALVRRVATWRPGERVLDLAPRAILLGVRREERGGKG